MQILFSVLAQKSIKCDWKDRKFCVQRNPWAISLKPYNKPSMWWSSSPVIPTSLTQITYCRVICSLGSNRPVLLYLCLCDSLILLAFSLYMQSDEGYQRDLPESRQCRHSPYMALTRLCSCLVWDLFLNLWT